MAKVTITIMDIPGESMIAVAVQSENLEQNQTPATICAGDVLGFMCQQVEGLEQQMLNSDVGVKH